MKQKLNTLLRDRLVWFVVLGLGLFALDYASGKRLESRILIDLPLVEKLVAQWEGQTKRRPNAQELDALVEGYIREEILVREARRLGLDDEDVIIRRRLAQKVEFFLDENNPPELPDEAGLKAWFDQNRAAYDTPAKLTWRHIYAGDSSHGNGTSAPIGAFIEILPNILNGLGITTNQTGNHMLFKVGNHGHLTAIHCGISQTVHTSICNDLYSDKISSRTAGKNFNVSNFQNVAPSFYRLVFIVSRPRANLNNQSHRVKASAIGL